MFRFKGGLRDPVMAVVFGHTRTCTASMAEIVGAPVKVTFFFGHSNVSKKQASYPNVALFGCPA